MAVANPDKVQALERTLGAPKTMNMLKSVLQGRVPVETYLRLAVQSAQRNPTLLAAEPASIVNGLLIGASLGLDFADGKGHAYLVPFKNNQTQKLEATFICGYQGYIELATRSGRVSNIIARAVYDGDEFDYNLATNEVTTHKISGAHDDPADITHVYCVATFPDSKTLIEVMTREQVESIRKRSRARGGPWTTDYEMMARKTVVRRLSHYLPKTDELAKAVILEDRAEQGDMDVSDLLPGAAAAGGSPIDVARDVLGDNNQSASDEPPNPGPNPSFTGKKEPSQPAQPAASAKARAKPMPAAKKQMADPAMVKGILDGAKNEAGLMEVLGQWEGRLAKKDFDGVAKYAGNLIGDGKVPVE